MMVTRNGALSSDDASHHQEVLFFSAKVMIILRLYLIVGRKNRGELPTSSDYITSLVIWEDANSKGANAWKIH